MTLEGCVVRISDIIGYLGRDIEDAVRLGVFNIEEIPQSLKEILGDSNRDIVSSITQDIIENSIGKDYISMSPNIYNAVKDLKSFNQKHIYDKANSDYKKNTSNARIVIDYISGMTDEYFISEFSKIK